MRQVAKVQRVVLGHGVTLVSEVKQVQMASLGLVEELEPLGLWEPQGNEEIRVREQLNRAQSICRGLV